MPNVTFMTQIFSTP